ncbi:MAG: alpha/beta hydrolase [Acidimicrobiales bacterium]
MSIGRPWRRAWRAAGAGIALCLATAVPAVGATASSGGHPAAGCTEGLTTVAVPLAAGRPRVTDDRVDVLLPSGYCSSAQRYPVLYLLHGAGDTYQSWSANTDLVAFARSYRMVIVMPDGGHNSQTGWYSNWLDGEYQWETYHTQVLPRYIDSHYRVLGRDIAIAGLSMGGFGALSYAARHPGTYRVAASFSGAVDTLYAAPLTGVVFAFLRSQYGTPDARIWGDQLTDEPIWAAHNPTSLAPRLAGTELLLASGTGTPAGPAGDQLSNPGGYALENGIFQMNLSLVAALDRAGVAHHDDFYLGGYHGWPYWQADLHWALPQIARALGPPRP